jgi:uncharacterized cupin superfamily protein
MTIGNLSTAERKESRSPKGKYALRRQVLVSGSTPKDTSPFEVELDELPPGATNYPFHYHTVDHEFFVVVSGSGKLRTKDGMHPINSGDFFNFPPREPHQIINDSDAPLVYYVVANNSLGHDACFYPDSKKWGFDAVEDEGKITTVSEVGYYTGEE